MKPETAIKLNYGVAIFDVVFCILHLSAGNYGVATLFAGLGLWCYGVAESIAKRQKAKSKYNG